MQMGTTGYEKVVGLWVDSGQTSGRQWTDLHGVTLIWAAGGMGHSLSSQTLVKGGLSFHRLEIT